MLSITKVNNTLVVQGEDNRFFPDNGELSFPMNALSLVLDESDMATFRSAANNDVVFSALIGEIEIAGETVTKDDIIAKFGAVANASSGGGGAGEDTLVRGKLKTQVGLNDSLNYTSPIASGNTVADDIQDIIDDLDEDEEVIAQAVTKMKTQVGLDNNLNYESPIESGNTIADDITALSQSGSGESPLAKGKWIKITLNVDDISEPTQILSRTADGYNISHTEAVYIPEDNYFEVFKDVSVEKRYHQFQSTGEKDIYFMVTGEGNTLNYGAFADMVNITSVVFPENIVALIQWIGVPLEGCSDLTSVTFNSTRSYADIEWSQFEAITTSDGTFHVRTELKNWWQNALTEKQQQGDTHPYVYWNVVDDAEEAGDGDALIATISTAYTDILDKFIRNVFEQQIGLNAALEYNSPLGHWGTVRDDVEELNTKIPTFTYDSTTQTLHITTNTTD